MKSLTIKPLELGRREQEHFQAILTLAGTVLKHDWNLVESDSADVFLIAHGPSGPHSVWDEYAGKYPSDRLVAYGDPANPAAEWHIHCPPESMPRLSEVANVLNHVAERLGNAGLAQPGALAAAPKGDGSCFDPRRHLAGIIQEAVERGECRVCSLADQPPLYLSPQENAVYMAADWKALSHLCRTDIDGIETLALPESELHERVYQSGYKRRRALSELLWFSLLTGSNGRLLAGHGADEPVHLREWPRYVKLPFYGMYLDIACQMAGESMGLGEIARKSAAPIQTVIDFHNACEFFGLVAHADEGRRLAQQKAAARDRLRSLVRPFFQESHYLRLVLVGTVGAGKTTALTTLSESLPILTEAQPSDAAYAHKSTTTVALEYGDIRIAANAKLQIYSTPGQRRFSFMGQILCAKAWGLLILIDNSVADPMGELAYYMDMNAKPMENGRVAVGISHCDVSDSPSIDDYRRFIRGNGHAFPVAAVDARDIDSLAALVSALAKLPSCEAPGTARAAPRLAAYPPTGPSVSRLPVEHAQ